MNYHDAISMLFEKYKDNINWISTKEENKLTEVTSIDNSSNDRIYFQSNDNYICANPEVITTIRFNSNIKVPQTIEDLFVQIDGEYSRGVIPFYIHFLTSSNNIEVTFEFK
ncbi:hypothetical protein NV379_02290 [Paenibacillus sp. N1-5-1-14]|uniref:hypothetical protein n=1 Tax=Paenibacillus radicibacter TaxID=2972488 RepID=UPI0021596C07|nr:hypothetical protein [Paenibacillus radicibacter]MCR8641476.1 hypothetical protein [Paenibacillus radicibacter]